MVLIFNPCGEFRWSPEGPVSPIHSPHLHAGATGIFQIFKFCSDTKERGGAESNGKYRTYSSLVKLQPWFLSLRWKTGLWAEPQPWWLSLQCMSFPGQNTLMMMMMMINDSTKRTFRCGIHKLIDVRYQRILLWNDLRMRDSYKN